MTDFNEPIVVSGVSAAILIYEMEFYEYARANGIKNPYSYKEFESVETETELFGKKVKGWKPVRTNEIKPPPEEYHFYNSMRELFIATKIFNERGWDEFVEYRDKYMKEESAKKSVEDWKPCKSEAEAQCRMDCDACGTGGCCGW